MQLCDSHCHLETNRYVNDRAEVIARARHAGVRMLITCGSDLATSKQQLELASQYPGVYAAVGIHGHEANSAISASNDEGIACDEEVFASLAELTKHKSVVALGELGLDYHYEFSPRQVQQVVLKRQLELAGLLNLPVILHNRESDSDLMEMVDAFPVRGVLHCFLGGPELLDWALNRGFYIGIAGPITYPRMENLHKLVKRIPLDKLLVETDSPYLAPQQVRGRRNEPANVAYVANQVAQILGMDIEQVAELTCTNARVCFGVKDAA
ncbi:MAG: TatD family hydrolase [Chloroflexi bacterium]|nr:TatD family hydrolase [Chloroflexota bacterium]